jgi:hypothetical protein
VARKNIIASGGGLMRSMRAAFRVKWLRMSRLMSQVP